MPHPEKGADYLHRPKWLNELRRAAGDGGDEKPPTHSKDQPKSTETDKED